MAKSRGVYVGNALGKVLMWRYFAVCSLLLSLVLSLGIAQMLLARTGNWPPVFLRPHPTVAITGPGINQQIEGYMLGAVLRPGVYRLHGGARVRELV